MSLDFCRICGESLWGEVERRDEDVVSRTTGRLVDFGRPLFMDGEISKVWCPECGIRYEETMA